MTAILFAGGGGELTVLSPQQAHHWLQSEARFCQVSPYFCALILTFADQITSINMLHKSHNAPFIFPTMHHSVQYRNVHISVLNGALWDMEQAHCRICEIGLLKCATRSRKIPRDYIDVITVRLSALHAGKSAKSIPSFLKFLCDFAIMFACHNSLKRQRFYLN